MKKMKKLILLLLSAALLFAFTGCGTKPVEPEVTAPSNDPFTTLKNILQSGGKLFGVAYLGKSEAEPDLVQEELSTKAFLKQVPYVADITEIAVNDGNELFCLIPADETVTVTVYKYGLNGTETPMPLERLISSNQPFLVRGNSDAYVPNLYVIAQKGEYRVEYPLVRSGIEARLENLDNAMFDFTPYNLLPEFHNLATEEKPLCASWLGDIRDAKDVEFALLLYIHESGEARFAYGNTETEMAELYIGTWELDGNRLNLSLKGGKPVYGAEVSEKNCSYEWDLDSGVMVLRYVEGDPLMPGTQDKILEFWSND